VCFAWQQWTETSVWLNDVGISAFHSCIVVDLFLSGVYYFLSVFWCLATRQRTCSHGTACEEVLASKQITVLERRPYSPDLVPSNFFLFHKIKEILKGRHFYDIDGIQKTSSQNCIEEWTRRCHRCIASQVEYFEGDHSDIQQ
jgi:hypothetical protein